MPSTVTEVDAFTATVQVPNDGEGATKASLLLAVQPLANRTKNLKGILTGGVIRVRSVADIAGLKGLSGMTTGDCAIVVGIGLYTFDGTTTPGSDTSPWILKPGSGSGQWVHELNLTRIAFATAGNKIVDTSQFAISAGTATTGSTTYADVAGWAYTIPTPTAFGDKVYIDVHFGANSSVGSATTSIRPVVTDDYAVTNVDTNHDEAKATTVSTTTLPFHRSFLHTVAGPSGVTRVKLQMKSDTGTAAIVGDGLFRVMVVRP